MKVVRTATDLVRGGLIGIVELIPGVSGGTIALIIGVYETIIDSVGEFVRGLVSAVVDVPRGRRLTRARGHFGQVRWSAVVPLAVGMVVALVLMAGVVAPLVEQYPVQSRAFFAGLVLVGLLVPARMVGGRWSGREWALAVPAAAVAFVVTGLPAATVSEPSWPLVAVAAALAVCALVMPGLSGSFVLLVLGLYQPTLEALNDRDVAYLVVFLTGMALGLGLFVQALRWLLRHRRRVTLAIMTGLMAGSLRALWPWQSEDRDLLAPVAGVPAAAGWFVLGMMIVASMLVAESELVRRRLAAGEDMLGADAGPS